MRKRLPLDYFSRVGNFLLDIFFPKLCVKCKREGRYLCKKCTLFISEASLICPFCGKAEFFGRRDKRCPKRELDGLISFWDYEGLVKELIYMTKYGSIIDIPFELLEYGFLSIEKNKAKFSKFFDFLFQEETIISYVPLHKKRKNKRGFDQAEIIAKSLAKITKKEYCQLLERDRETREQAKLKKEERLLNIRDAFSFCCEKKVESVVLVDDVWTSGFTIKECCKVLKKNGVKSVWGFTLAKTP